MEQPMSSWETCSIQHIYILSLNISDTNGQFQKNCTVSQNNWNIHNILSNLNKKNYAFDSFYCLQSYLDSSLLHNTSLNFPLQFLQDNPLLQTWELDCHKFCSWHSYNWTGSCSKRSSLSRIHQQFFWAWDEYHYKNLEGFYHILQSCSPNWVVVVISIGISFNPLFFSSTNTSIGTAIGAFAVINFSSRNFSTIAIISLSNNYIFDIGLK